MECTSSKDLVPVAISRATLDHLRRDLKPLDSAPKVKEGLLEVWTVIGITISSGGMSRSCPGNNSASAAALQDSKDRDAKMPRGMVKADVEDNTVLLRPDSRSGRDRDRRNP